ncbi:hypothetical protein PTKIN_Ptkin04bG0050900 [Pterospermum kingtungense]
MHTSAKMQQSVPLASRYRLSEEPQKGEEWHAEEIHLTDDKHEVSELPVSPNCSTLIALYLQGNFELTAIPPLFFQRIQVLNLSHTSIKSLPKSLPNLVALKKLCLQGCKLFMELSPEVGEFRNLEELDLDETQIMDLPREIGKLLKLKHLTVSFYHVCGKKKSKSNILIDPDAISILSQLTELSIDVNPADKRWDDSVEAVVKEVCNSKTLRALSLYLPKFQLLDHASFVYPSLSRFRFTVGHHKRRIISRVPVPHEVEAEFRKWDKCLEFVNGENIPIEIKRVLNNSTSFFLNNHATALNLSEFGIENMKRLKVCLLAECNKMENLIDGEMHFDTNEDDQCESDPDYVEYVLESLQYLSIYYMENLEIIWRGPNHYGCMSKLKFLALHTCPKLNIIFSHTLLENLVNLEEFILEDCPQVTSLVSRASVDPSMLDKKFLPSLKRLLLLYLPELISISNGLLMAPKLEIVGFYNCPKLKSMSKMELSSKNLKIIRGECQWWEDLNWNETEWGSCPDYLMPIFSPINNKKDVMTQLAENTDFFEATMQKEGQELERLGMRDRGVVPMGNCWGSSSARDGTSNIPTTLATGASNNSSNNMEFSATSSTSNCRSQFSETVCQIVLGRLDRQILETRKLKAFTLTELKTVTRNFRSDVLLGEGRFGRVYKGWMDEKTLTPFNVGSGMAVAVKIVTVLNHGSVEGLKEWLSEVNFLGGLSHPNLVKLFGYCCEDKERLLVYEFMQKGSLETYLYRNPAIEPLSWELRLKIIIGAARDLAFLNTS